jgi:peptidyl-prolyl cis-trans isomerase D
MALIGTLRNKMGTWVVVFVFVAIAAFTLNDLLGNNSVLLGSNHVGEIGNHTVSYEEYSAAIRQQEINYQMYFQRNPTDRDQPLLQNQAWELLVARYAITPEYEKLGVKVTLDEVDDMVRGKNVNETITQAPIFLNDLGVFDPNKVTAYIQDMSRRPEGDQELNQWLQFQQSLHDGRIRIKYENLLVKSEFVTSAEAEREYHMQNDVAEIKYIYVPYYSISDSAATVTDSDLRDYYNRNKEQFKTEAFADLSYVTFPVLPSAQDSLEIRQDLQQLAEEFRVTQDDSLFALTNSESQAPFGRYTPNMLPPYLPADSIVAGKVMGPFLDGTSYKVIKVSRVGKDTLFTARARHILIKWLDEADKGRAREQANNIIKELKAGADFASKAREVSADPGSAQNGGDLGWFSNNGGMVKPFEDAVFGASKPGLLNAPVESEFGYHIIDVTNVKDNTAYWIGELATEITPSDASINEAARKAEMFRSQVANKSEFEKQAETDAIQVLAGKDVKSNDRRVGMLSDARQVVQWAFRDGSEGSISDVFDLQDQYVVAVLDHKIEKGYKPLDLVKEDITPQVRDEVKGRMISEKLKSLTGTLEEIAQAFGPDASIRTSSDLHPSSSSLPSVGVDPEVLGLVFSLETGKRTPPFSGETGVVVIEMINRTVAPDLADYSMYKGQLEQGLRGRTTYGIADAIKENAGIEDSRYRFF